LIEKAFKINIDNNKDKSKEKEANKKGKSIKRNSENLKEIKKNKTSDKISIVEEKEAEIVEEETKLELNTYANSSNINLIHNNNHMNNNSQPNKSLQIQNETIKKQLSSITKELLDDESPDDSKFISLLEREQLSCRVKRLANDGLASLVRLVQKECPSSIEDVDDEKLMIKITDLDRKTYEQINQLIDTFLRVRETNQENLGNKRARDKNTNF
jgi:hypothetical protein